MKKLQLFRYVCLLLTLTFWQCAQQQDKQPMPPLPDETNNNIEKKIAYLSKIIQDNQANAEVFYQRASLNLSLGKENLALIDIDRALSLNNNEADYYWVRALALDQKADFERALVAAQKAENMNLDRGIQPAPSTFKLMGKWYYLQKDTATARRYLLAAQQSFPDHAEVYYYLGLLGRDAGDTIHTVANLRTAIDLQPNYPEAYTVLIDFYRKRGNRRLATAAAAEAVMQCPNQPRLMETYADLLMLSEERESAAMRWYQQAADLSPNNWRLHYIVGMYHHRERHYAEAEKYLTTALANKPDLEKALYNLGTIYEYQYKRLPDALAKYEQAVKITPYDTVFIYSVRRVKKKIAYEEYKQSPQYILDQMRKRKEEEAARLLQQDQ
ncbi:tetratricopeptide repeat protein [Rhodoflexus sp.]